MQPAGGANHGTAAAGEGSGAPRNGNDGATDGSVGVRNGKAGVSETKDTASKGRAAASKGEWVLPARVLPLLAAPVRGTSGAGVAPEKHPGMAAVAPAVGHMVALYHRSSTSSQIHCHIRYRSV